jgi:dynein heavy chain
MISEGLPRDRVSIENGSIVTNCKRWLLIIDPQNQGIKWLKKREELTQKDWVKIMQKAITKGNCFSIENLGSETMPNWTLFYHDQSIKKEEA